MEVSTITEWLKTQQPQRLETLWQKADLVRKQHVGDGVHLRGLLEISNHCIRSCTYCGLRVERKELQRYRMTAEQILQGAMEAVDYNYGTVVMQAGEDYGIKAHWLARIIDQIKSSTNLAVTLSMGERPLEDYQLWKDAGADRILIRLETTDPQLYKSIHPQIPGRKLTRDDILKAARDMGYEIGSGVMVGIPGQTYQSLARDILTFARLDLDMIGVGPFIAHPDTPAAKASPARHDQVPNTELMTYKVVALTRIFRSDANIPGTSALATLNIAQGRENALTRGANVVMPNLTPTRYRSMYEIYPAKACINETAVQCRDCLKRRIGSLGREISAGPGNRTKADKTTDPISILKAS